MVNVDAEALRGALAELAGDSRAEARVADTSRLSSLSEGAARAYEYAAQLVDDMVASSEAVRYDLTVADRALDPLAPVECATVDDTTRAALQRRTGHLLCPRGSLERATAMDCLDKPRKLRGRRHRKDGVEVDTVLVYMPPEVGNALRIRAATERETMSGVVVAALKQYLGERA